MFGDKFYRYLSELKNWQRSLFALALAQRMSNNYILYAQATENHEWASMFAHVLSEMWIYHTDKDNHVDLQELLHELEYRMPELSDDSPYGAYPALDACHALSASINAIVSNTGEEALVASKASVCTVAKFLEVTKGQEFTDDELRDFPLMEQEIEYQVMLLQKCRGYRDTKVITTIRDEIIASGVSNIGISLED